MAGSGREIIIAYRPRKWALKIHASFRRWTVAVMHRRCGKTTMVLNHHQRACLSDTWERERLLYLRPQLTDADVTELLHPAGGRHYGHVMPTRVQAKTVAWDKLKFYCANIPGVRPNESELLVRYPNGNKLQLFGADDPDSLRGPMFSGLSFDEYSQQPRNIFSEVLSKALADHLGYAMFVGTIKGKDHLYDTYQAGKSDPAWTAIWQDVDASLASEDGITIKLLEQAMTDDRDLVAKGLMTQDEFDQEWYLSPEAAIKGAWFGTELAAAAKAKRLTRVPYDPQLPVDTDWDLGVDDSTAIWFSQSTRAGEVRLIDYYEASGEGLPHYLNILRMKPYTYGQHWPPHDINVRELSSGKSRKELAAALGLRFEPPPTPVSFVDGINAARLLFPRCWFDAEHCTKGLEALRQYRKSYNQRLNEFTGTPIHDWSSHAADAFRGLAVRHKTPEAARRQVHRGRSFRPSLTAWMG